MVVFYIRDIARAIIYRQIEFETFIAEANVQYHSKI